MIRALTPLAHVASVPASIEFYTKLGLEVGNTFTPPDASEPSWAWLKSASAEALMIAKASHPIDAGQQAVLFYLYVDDVSAKQAELAASGVRTGDIAYPFYAPRGELRVVDPDGYVLMITHT